MIFKNRKLLIALAAAVTLIAGLTYYLFLAPAGVPGQLYRYYPSATGFYLELAPGEKLVRRFVAFLDEKATAQDRQQSTQPLLTSPPAESNPPPALSATTLPNTSPATAQQTKQKHFRHVFLQKFNNTFDPYFSIGIWPDKADRQGNGDILVIFPLKDKLDLPQVVRRFDLSLSDFEQKTYQKTPYFIEKDSQTTLAILNQKLLMTNTAQAMVAALAHYQQHQPNVYDEPNNKAYLARLPRLRQGTFILNNTVYTSQALTRGEGSLAQGIGNQVNGLSPVIPLTVGAIQAQRGNLVSLRFVTPVLLKNLPSDSFRKSLQAAYQPSEHFTQAAQLPQDTTFMVGLAGTDKLFDFYRDFMLPPEAARMLKVTDFYLSTFRLDLRRDIVSLLARRTVLASRLKAPSLILLIDKDSEKDKTLDKISTLLSTNAFPVKQTTEQVGDQSIKTLSLSEGIPNRRKEQISYGTLATTADHLIVFASPSDYLDLLRIGKGEAKSLANAPAYSALMTGMPERSNLLLYMNIAAQSHLLQQRTPTAPNLDWLDSLALSLQSNPYQPNEIDLLEGQLNLKLSTAR